MVIIPVLIVGAGPSGLMMACELVRHGIPFRIIDKKPEQTLTSNATGIQTRTIEMFDEIGIVAEFIQKGNRCNSINMYSQGKSFVKIPFENLDSLYKFILMLPQAETERILNTYLENLGHSVERPVELVSFKQADGVVEVVLHNADGVLETVHCDWLIGCDGSNSVVREKCEIYFPGEDLQDQFIVADAKMDSFLHADQVHVFLDQGTFFATFALGHGQYRVGANLNLGYTRKLYTEKEVKELAIERSYGNYNIQSVSWISPFWIHSRVVNKMRDASVFLVGDAAHVHSPAGGQGMNTGLQDAYNLAWKLALVVKGNAPESLLDTYQEERLPIVRQIVSATERFTKLGLLSNLFLIRMRNLFYRVMLSCPVIAKKISMRMTQLAIQYKNSSIINNKNKMGRHSPQPGMRAPDVKIGMTTRLHDYLRGTSHQVLIFAGCAPVKEQLEQIKELRKWLKEHYDRLVNVHVVTNEVLEGVGSIILDEGLVVHCRYDMKRAGVCIIRPDRYVGYGSVGLEKAGIERYFSPIFNATH